MPDSASIEITSGIRVLVSKDEVTLRVLGENGDPGVSYALSILGMFQQELHAKGISHEALERKSGPGASTYVVDCIRLAR